MQRLKKGMSNMGLQDDCRNLSKLKSKKVPGAEDNITALS